MDFMIGVFVFIVGVCIGSFLNVCIYRIPNKISIVKPSSHCPKCKNKLKIFELVPVLSYIFLKGKCRNCGEKISPRYMIVELLTGLLFLGCFLVVGFSVQLLAYACLTSVLIAITFIDLDHLIIPDSIVIFGLIAGIIFVALGFVPVAGAPLKENIIGALIGLACGAGPLIVINLLSLLLFKRPGIGGGDIKLMGMVGLFLGMKATIISLLIGVFVAGAYGVFFMMNNKSDYDEKKKEKKDSKSTMTEIPFGPFLAIGCYFGMLFGENILTWYLGFFA